MGLVLRRQIERLGELPLEVVSTSQETNNHDYYPILQRPLRINTKHIVCISLVFTGKVVLLDSLDTKLINKKQCQVLSQQDNHN